MQGYLANVRPELKAQGVPTGSTLSNLSIPVIVLLGVS